MEKLNRLFWRYVDDVRPAVFEWMGEPLQLQVERTSAGKDAAVEHAACDHGGPRAPRSAEGGGRPPWSGRRRASSRDEQTGFSYDRPKGKNHCVMRKTVSPVTAARRARVR